MVSNRIFGHFMIRWGSEVKMANSKHLDMCKSYGQKVNPNFKSF